MGAPDIVVGTKLSEVGKVAHTVQWVKVGDVELDSDKHAVLSVDHHADCNFHEVTIRLACRSYSTEVE